MATVNDGPFDTTDDEVHQDVAKDTTGEFKQQANKVLGEVASAGLLNSLEPFSFGAKVVAPNEITAAVTMPLLSKGDPSTKYNIVLQPGHYLRVKIPGKDVKLGTSGKLVTEQQITAFITANVAKNLIEEDKDKKLNILVVSADNYDRPLNTDIFLSIHADGAPPPGCTTGPSLGYSDNSSLLGMHAIAFALATSLGQTYDEFQGDNFTTNLSKYYMFKSLKLPPKGFAGVLEVGELTCEKKEKALIENALRIAKNISSILRSSVDIINEPLDKK
ncbi:hypothetical protein BB934_45805 (plasmid) [Microvirga ossetica]|uniref:N-acetylmuramoyl-L-alanine amidase n=1 Tax=Microvirga ossetica TaxID=1882682 RepID=A0A1B2F062_9HYPH|nr:hypothetical protein BB934_45805 [Microvirga ossetica]